LTLSVLVIKVFAIRFAPGDQLSHNPNNQPTKGGRRAGAGG
jgi:hypothetical protein